MVAAAIAVAAAVGEARGLRIVPQVRRQVPESWRRVLPVPLAAGLYGVLLGLGFTTFILTFAVWALAAVSVALGDPALGAVLGLAFGAGRALPVIALAPIADGDRGNAAHAAMAERPAILRGLRAADAVALALCAAVIGVAPAQAAEPRASAAPPPSPPPRRPARPPTRACSPSSARAAPATCAAAGTFALPGRDPALAAGLVGWRDAARIVLADPNTLAPVATYESPGGGAFAFSDQWVVWRVGTAQLVAQPRNLSAAPRVVATARAARAARPPVARRPGARLPPRRRAPAAPDPAARPRQRRGAACCAPSDGRCCSTPPSTAASCSTCARPTRARSSGSARPAAARPTRDRRLYSTTPTGRRDAGHEKGHGRHRAGYPGGRPPRLAPRPPAGVVDHAVDHGARAARGVCHATAPPRGHDHDDGGGAERPAVARNERQRRLGREAREPAGRRNRPTFGCAQKRITVMRFCTHPNSRAASRLPQLDRTPRTQPPLMFASLTANA